MKKNILQVCRLTPLWGVDLFKQISLAYSDHHVTTVFLSGKKIPELQSQYHGSVIFLEINHKKVLWRVKAALKLWQLCQQHPFDIVICHHYKPTVIMDWVSYFYPHKKYFSFHHTLANFRRLGRRCYARLSLNRHWQFITVSDAVKQDLLDANTGIRDAQVQTIHNCIILDEILVQQYSREKARAILNIEKNAFVFGTIGRLVSAKAHTKLIHAFSKIHHQIPRAMLIILGTGPLEASLRTQISALGLQNKIHIPSDHAKTAGYFLQAFDTFVFPSIQEGFGLVLLEAMAAKLPIIGTGAGGIPEVLGETGLLISNTTEQLSGALIKTYQLPKADRLKMGVAGYERLCQHFLQTHFKASLTQTLLHRPLKTEVSL
jgi:glycosyltransferase involved in cell wall biosynthesis